MAQITPNRIPGFLADAVPYCCRHLSTQLPKQKHPARTSGNDDELSREDWNTMGI